MTGEGRRCYEKVAKGHNRKGDTLGEVEIEIGDGTKRIFGTGEILLAEDTTGQGHISRAVAGKPRKSLFITVSEVGR